MDFYKTLSLLEVNLNDPRNQEGVQFDIIKDKAKIQAADRKLLNNKKVKKFEIKDPTGKKVIGYKYQGIDRDLKVAGLQ